MSLRPQAWASAYRPLHPVSLAVQLGLLILSEVALFASYDVHDARFHWATHFLVALAFVAVLLLSRLLLTGAPGPRLLLLILLAAHVFAMAPDLLFRIGVPHDRWMNVFLGHIAVHHLPGGDGSWLAIALVLSAAYVAALTAWLRARRAEADLGMPPGVGLTGMAVLRAQRDPRTSTLGHKETGAAGATETVVLIHGLGASSAFWRPVTQELSGRGLRTLTPDLLGFAGSIRLGTHFHLDDQAAAVLRLIEQHDGGAVVLVAHSYGAAVAVELALDRPDLIERMVLIAPAAFSSPSEARERIGGRSWMAGKAMSGAVVADVACGAMCLLRRPLTSLAPRMAKHVPSDVARDGVTYVWPAYRDGLTSMLTDDSLVRWLADPPVATVVVMADDDATVLADGLMALLGPAVQAIRLPGTHALPLERPLEIADIIVNDRSQLGGPSL